IICLPITKFELLLRQTSSMRHPPKSATIIVKQKRFRFYQQLRLKAVGEHNQQQCYAAAVHGAQRLQNAALEGVPLAENCHRTWKVAEMGSVWRCPSGAFRIPTF